jgi:hypothetical protein
MSKQRSFLQCWLLVCWLPIVGAVVGVRVQSLRITSKPQRFISLAKVLAQPRGNAKGDSGSYKATYIDDFYGTTIETLEHTEMRRRALDRVRALHPDLKVIDVAISASRNKNSAVINIHAYGTEPKYTRIFLDALLDEFVAFRNQIREQQRSTAVITLLEDVTRREKTLNAKRAKLADFEKVNNSELLRGELNRLTKRVLSLRDERDDLQQKKSGSPLSDGFEKQLASTTQDLAKVENETTTLAIKVAIHEELSKDYQDSKRAYDDILDLVRRFSIADDMMIDHVAIMERASGAVEDLQEWATPIAIGLIAGGLGGLLLSLLLAAILRSAILRAATRSTQPPPLPTLE